MGHLNSFQVSIWERDRLDGPSFFPQKVSYIQIRSILISLSIKDAPCHWAYRHVSVGRWLYHERCVKPGVSQVPLQGLTREGGTLTPHCFRCTPGFALWYLTGVDCNCLWDAHGHGDNCRICSYASLGWDLMRRGGSFNRVPPICIRMCDRGAFRGVQPRTVGARPAVVGLMGGVFFPLSSLV